MRRAAAAVALALALPAATGCSAGGADDTRTLTVYAAASLREPFDALAEELERRHDDVRVEVSHAGSTDLVAQVVAGAPADVVATADTASMDRLVAEDLAAGTPEVFARNTLRIVVPPGNPADVTGLDDLGRDGLALVVCAPEVPCGAATAQVAATGDVALRPVSEERSVTDVLGKVTSGEADAGLVYVTDAVAAGDAVEQVDLPEAGSVVNDYPVVPVAGAEEPELAAELVALLRGEVGRDVLRDAGFRVPAP